MIVNCTAYADGRKLGAITLDDIPTLRERPDVFVWLGLFEPDEELMTRVKELFGLHELAAEDAHHAHQRPKVELYGDCLFVVLRTAQTKDGKVEFGETHLFIGPGYLVSVRHGASLPYATVRARCESSPNLLRKGPGFVLYAILDFVVDQYFPVLNDIEDAVDDLEERFFKGDFDQGDIGRLYEFKRDLVELRRAAAPLVEVCNYLLTDVFNGYIADDIRPYFRDVYDHTLRINEAVEAIRETLALALQISLSLGAARQNDATKRLAGWGALLTIPTMVFSIYGMNFAHMPELQWRYGYPALMGTVLAACLLLYRQLKKTGWL
ncbi:MAG TPA: magnesium and cobalt transport protein CorA [Candidatus Competibacter sp.]|nr:magnesium transporter [Candidatus Competibacteraceae bacterium]HRE54913.1 magnesium and cobalt transport protein CorA [Candidatus Competibacter sp.]HUM94298.1 magnesium and cobalt transport protein CorA [Candidatus Competibacter sp.]